MFLTKAFSCIGFCVIMPTMYVDESGDTGVVSGSPEYFILSGMVIHELRWSDALDSIIDFRRNMKRRQDGN
jgi:hypothetical protein